MGFQLHGRINIEQIYHHTFLDYLGDYVKHQIRHGLRTFDGEYLLERFSHFVVSPMPRHSRGLELLHGLLPLCLDNTFHPQAGPRLEYRVQVNVV